jgi:hypothetical protein
MTAMAPRKRKTFSFVPRGWAGAGWLQSCAFILAVNWVAQGMRGMQAKELAFRLLLELALTVAVAAPLAVGGVGTARALVIGLLAAHSFGFTANGQFWVCARYCPAYRRDPRAVEAWLQRTVARLAALAWLDEALCIGSRGGSGVVRGTRSDLDLRLVFPRGAWAWCRVNLLLLALRADAFLRMIPIDLYAYDTPAALDRFDQREALLVILDRRGRLHHRFRRRVHPWPE